MRNNLKNYLDDGANYQARGVLMFLQPFDIEESWDKERKEYLAEPTVARWENCREQGYVVSMRSQDMRKQLNIAFFEHRNSDSICAVKWEQVTINAPTIDTANFGNVYKDKYDTSFDVGYGEVSKMADLIRKELTEFWMATKTTENESKKIGA